VPLRIGVPYQPYHFLVKKLDDLIVVQNDKGRVQWSGTDLSALIDKALNALTSGRTWIETVKIIGSYIVNSKINLPSYTRLDLRDAYLKAKDGLNTYMLDTYEAGVTKREIELIGGVLDGNRENQTDGSIMRINYTYHWRLKGVTFKSGYEYGLEAGSASTHGLLESCYFFDNRLRAATLSGAFTKLVGCHAVDNPYVGFELNHIEITAVGCTAYNNGFSGFLLRRGSSLIGCVSAYNKSHQIYLWGADHAIIIGCQGNDSQVAGKDGIALYDTNYARIIGCSTRRIDPYRMRYGVSILTAASTKNIIKDCYLTGAETANLYDAGTDTILGEVKKHSASLIGAAGATAGTTVNTLIHQFQVVREQRLKRIDSYFKTAYADYVVDDQGWIVIYDADAASDIAKLELTSGEKVNGGAVSGTLSPGTNYQILIRVTSTDATTPATPPEDGVVTVSMMENTNIIV